MQPRTAAGHVPAAYGYGQPTGAAPPPGGSTYMYGNPQGYPQAAYAGAMGGTAATHPYAGAPSPAPSSGMYQPTTTAGPPPSSPYSSAPGMGYGRSVPTSPSTHPPVASTQSTQFGMSPRSSSPAPSMMPLSASSSSSPSPSTYSNAPLSMSTAHVKREPTAPYAIPTWEQKEREIREQQYRHQSAAEHPYAAHPAQHPYVKHEPPPHQMPQQPPQPDLHGPFNTRGDAVKRLTLCASMLDTPLPPFNADEWNNQNEAKRNAINERIEAATKSFVSLLQSEMTGVHDEDTILIMRLQCSDLQSEARAEREREMRSHYSPHPSTYASPTPSPYGSADSVGGAPASAPAGYGQPYASPHLGSPSPYHTQPTSHPASYSPHPQQHPSYGSSHPVYAASPNPSAHSPYINAPQAPPRGGQPPMTMSPAHLPPHHPSASPAPGGGYPPSAFGYHY